jgi:hypothetical protein
MIFIQTRWSIYSNDLATSTGYDLETSGFMVVTVGCKKAFTDIYLKI